MRAALYLSDFERRESTMGTYVSQIFTRQTVSKKVLFSLYSGKLAYSGTGKKKDISNLILLNLAIPRLAIGNFKLNPDNHHQL